MQREEKVDWEPVGRVAPKQATPPGLNSAIASRLRPLNSNEAVVPTYSAPQYAATYSYTQPRIAASTVGRLPVMGYSNWY